MVTRTHVNVMFIRTFPVLFPLQPFFRNTPPWVAWLNSADKGKKVKWSRYRPSVAQRVGRGIVLLFHDRGTRRGWVVSSTPRPHFTPGKDPVPILQEAGCAPGPVWMGGKSRPHRDSIPNRPARSQSLYRLSYPAHLTLQINAKIHVYALRYTVCYCGQSLNRGMSTRV